MIVALVGQPNSGKSTVFNAVAGYRTVTGNFPGTTVEVARSSVRYGGEQFDLVDLPGIYSLSSVSADESQAVDALLALKPDVVVHVMDASVLSRSLELTIELLELGFPLVLCLNMMDEAKRKGVAIDLARLEREVGAPVVPAIAARGEGIAQLFAVTVETARRRQRATPPAMSRDVESPIEILAGQMTSGTASALGLPPRLLALKLLEHDEQIERRLESLDPGLVEAAREARQQVATTHGRAADVVVSSERHALSMNIFERVAHVTARSRESPQDWVDRFVLHPIWGYPALAAVAAAFFYGVFGLGGMAEAPLVAFFGRLGVLLAEKLPAGSLALTVLAGLLQGFTGGIGIVLPYLIPFLAGLAILEDLGYIPRAAFLTDALMHRIGLHGKAVIPLILGYGCTVPAVMATRIMETRRDRYVTALLVTFIPCAARTTIVFAMVGFFLGPWGALGFFVLNLLVVAAVGRLLLRVRREDSPGLILEIPPYRRPHLSTVLNKVWFRLREFIVVAWPILIAGSILLSLIEHFGLASRIDGILAPVTSGLLGLPPAVGVSLIFGVLRKELTIVMLVQALGTANFASVLTPTQMAVYTAFTLFYVPCLATLAMLRAVIGLRGMLVAALSTTGVALLIALAFRLISLVPL